MSNVFISSVIGGFEGYRDAAKRTVELLGHTPIMSESFGARAYSSEIACITEVQRCDVYVLILGESYGYVPEGDQISVTHAEYEAARNSNKPILVFVQSTDMDDNQRAFRQEVEHYQSGAFRQGFSTEQELVEGIVQALSTWERGHEAIPADAFDQRVDDALTDCSRHGRHTYNARVVLAYLPEPQILENLSVIERGLDDLFTQLCQSGYAGLRNGYEAQDGRHWTGLQSGNTLYAVFEDGLRMLITTPDVERRSTIGYFLPPDVLRTAAVSFLDFIPISSGHYGLKLLSMDQAFIAEDPGGNSVSMRGLFGGQDEYSTSQYFNPMSRGAFEAWFNRTLGSIERQYGYPPRTL